MPVKKLKVIMFEKEITQKKLAEVLEIDLSSLNLKINGKRDFTLSEIKAILSYFNVKFEDIFFENNIYDTKTA